MARLAIPLLKDGKRYAVGDDVKLTATEAKALAAFVVKPAPKKDAKS